MIVLIINNRYDRLSGNKRRIRRRQRRHSRRRYSIICYIVYTSGQKRIRHETVRTSIIIIIYFLSTRA